MPTEQPRLPKETHRYLLQGRDANRHMPIIGYEVAEYRRGGINLSRLLIGALYCAFFLFFLCLVFYAGWVWAEAR